MCYITPIHIIQTRIHHIHNTYILIITTIPIPIHTIPILVIPILIISIFIIYE